MAIVNRTRRERAGRDPEGRMPLTEHLRELRNRLVKAFLAIAVFAVLGWIYYEPIFSFLTEPIDRVMEDAKARGLDLRLTLTGVTEAFTLQVRVAAMAGVVLASPVWIYQLWAFVTPGLHRHEKRYTIAFVAAAVPLFVAGMATAWWMLPKGLYLLFGFTPSNVSNYISVDTYLSFMIRMMLVFGLGFLAPVFVLALNFVGILSARNIRNSWRWTIMGVLVFAAVATPDGNPINMLLLALPMLVLLAGAFGIAALNDRRRARASEAIDYDDLDDDTASPVAAPERIDAPTALDDDDRSTT